MIVSLSDKNVLDFFNSIRYDLNKLSNMKLTTNRLQQPNLSYNLPIYLSIILYYMYIIFSRYTALFSCRINKICTTEQRFRLWFVNSY